MKEQEREKDYTEEIYKAMSSLELALSALKKLNDKREAEKKEKEKKDKINNETNNETNS